MHWDIATQLLSNPLIVVPISKACLRVILRRGRERRALWSSVEKYLADAERLLKSPRRNSERG